MKLIESECFVFEDKNYEIHVYNDGWDITVKVYFDGKPANGYSYTVSLPTGFDLFKISQTDAVRVLKDKAKKDVEEKIWQKYVDNYISNLKKAPSELLGCRKCSSRKIMLYFIDDRNMYECEECGNIWYEERKTYNPFTDITDNITDGVEKNGFNEMDVVLLLNTVFKQNDKVGLSFQDQLKNWAKNNKLKYQINSSAEPNKIRFWR